MSVCGQIPEAPGAVADALIALASLGEAGHRAIGHRGKRLAYENDDVIVPAERFLQGPAQVGR